MTRKLIASALLVSLLSACGSEKHTVTVTEGTVVTEPDHNVELSVGRLAVNFADSSDISIIDLETNQLLDEITLTNPASALYTSPEGRYLVAIQRNFDTVEFIDGGIFLEAHNDHFDLIENAPSAVSFELLESKPTHYVPSEEHALIFFDGDRESSADAGFALFSDEGINEGKLTAEHHFETYQHGTGQIRGDFVISTLRDTSSDSTLPETIALFEMHDDHFHQDQTFTDQCPGLHGSFQTEEYIAFACTDGVVKIKQEGDLFTSSKIANPESMPEGVRIGKFIGSHESNTLIGLSRGGVFTVNLDNDEISPFQWQADGVTNYLAYAQTGNDEAIVVLDDVGFINVFEQENDWQLAKRFQVLDTIEQETTAQLIANKAKEIIYLVYGERLINIDLEADTASEIFTFEQPVNKAAWLGAMEQHEHDH